MATFKAVTLNGEGHVKKDGTVNVKIRLTHNRKAEYISTDLYVFPDTLKNGSATGENSAFINDRIFDYLSKYQKEYLKLGDTSRVMSASEVKNAITSEKSETVDFIKFADKYFEQLKAECKLGSIRAVRGLLTNLKAFSPTLYFHQITPKYLNSFEKYLISQGVVNGVSTYMSRLRVIFNKGREEFNDEDRGIIKIANYPFKNYKIEQSVANSQDNCLTIDQMKILLNYQPVTTREKLAKDMFLLQFYLIGINTKDLFFAKQPEKQRIKFNRLKTIRFRKKLPYSIKIEPESKAIIEKYKGQTNLLVFADIYEDYLNFQKAINIGLASICENVNGELIRKKKKPVLPAKITSNWARHTWATIARNDCEIDKDDVALCLGHEDQDNKVTDIYIRYDYSIVDKSNRKVIDLICVSDEAQ